jgi:glycosyltransferase involved in cell wall biosynthesis
MKILHTVEFYEPSHGGMQEVVKQISERLVKYGHSVTVATSKHSERTVSTINRVAIKEFDISGNLVNGFNGVDIESYQQYLLNSDFDIVINFAAQQWATDLMLPLLPCINAKKVSVPTGFSGLFLSSYQDYFENMKTWMKQYDVNIFHTTTFQDIEFAKKNGIDNYVVISNGASEEEFGSETGIDARKMLKIPDNRFLILFVGSFDGRKGHAEAIEIFKKANIMNATLVITGSVYSKRLFWETKIKAALSRINTMNKSILVMTSLPRPFIVELYKESDLFLFPSTWECSPIVLFESMAAGTPFLVTDVGNSKEIIEWSHCGTLLPTIKDEIGYSHVDIDKSSKVLEDLHRDSKNLEQMGKQGYISWKNSFTWDIIAKKYESTYKHLLE